MDPNVALAQVRDLAADVRADPFDVTAVHSLVEAITALDEWITAGGFLPEAWDAALRGGQ
jgi:hypothetical protein